ncbi:hypothetical protein BDP81DRAFT_437736 [Colletotrichum phormii]|uniref:Uncharacterized protein n=1 Tax=Colletotrichum phormii TaxID=359342 RepID=A0AAJ0ECD3_9PEZI|nr:uncharacterized protein BDP81DRAFT_437736 [Colletotrichum phormii]KAK1624527.1 hypothetical protein BDP81DRAFT_437736 [Colletotrichum phormii]
MRFSPLLSADRPSQPIQRLGVPFSPAPIPSRSVNDAGKRVRNCISPVMSLTCWIKRHVNT